MKSCAKKNGTSLVSEGLPYFQGLASIELSPISISVNKHIPGRRFLKYSDVKRGATMIELQSTTVFRKWCCYLFMLKIFFYNVNVFF